MMKIIHYHEVVFTMFFYPMNWVPNELIFISFYFILFHCISWACHLLGKFSNRYWYTDIYIHTYIYTCEWIYLLYPNTNDCQPSHVQVRVVYRRLTRHRSSGPSLAIAGWRRWRPAENMGVVSTKTWEYYLGYNQPIWFKDLFEYLLGFAAWTAIFRNLGLRIRPLSSDNLLSQVLDHHWIWSVAPCEPSAGQNLSTSETQISGLSFQWAIPFWAKISRVPTCFFSIAACWSPTHQIALEKITQWSAGFGHAVLLLSDGERIEIHNATSQLRRMEWHTPMFDHIVWTCPCRPCNMDIPPRQGEVLVARVGLFSLGCWHRSCSCLACVCATLHLGSPAWLLVLCRSRHMFAHLSCLFLGLPCFPPFLFGVDYWRVPGTMFGVLPCGLGEGTDLVSACVHVRCSFGKFHTCTQISAGSIHTVPLRSDGSAVAIGENRYGQCNILPPEPGICYVGNLTMCQRLSPTTRVSERGWCCRADMLVFGWVRTMSLDCTRCRIGLGKPHFWIARELNAKLPNLQLVLPDGQLLAKICQANPEASVASDPFDPVMVMLGQLLKNRSVIPICFPLFSSWGMNERILEQHIFLDHVFRSFCEI